MTFHIGALLLISLSVSLSVVKVKFGHLVQSVVISRLHYKAVLSSLLPRKFVNKMPSIVGKYQHYKNEDVEDYFTAVGVPYIGRKMMSMSSPLMEITMEGDNITIKNSSMIRTTEYTFKLGEEYQENMPNTTIKSVTTLVNDHELQTDSVIPENGAKCGRHYLFTDDECIITLTHEKAKPGKRYFKKIN